MTTTPIVNANNIDISGLLYLINKSEGFFSHRIRLQKMVLLAQKEFNTPFSYSYESYYYGPYSRELQTTISNLISDGLLIEETIESPYGNVSYYYKATPKGTELSKGLDKVIKTSIDRLWEKYSNHTTDFIVKSAKEISHIGSLNER